LRTVQFWLEQNARLLATTIQALEVQRMTLTTLKTMNVTVSDLCNAMKLRAPAGPGNDKAARGEQGAAQTAAPAGVVDPMQWWGALTQQFTQLAASRVEGGRRGRSRKAGRLMPGASPAPAAKPPRQAAGADPSRPHRAAAGQTAERGPPKARVTAALSAVLPAQPAVAGGEGRGAYGRCDQADRHHRASAGPIALPETEAQVSRVLRACHALGVPVVARGAGTGLSGGALPHSLGVTLALAKFNRIVSVDKHSRTAVVQCGVRNLAISEAAAPLGLYYAPDPSSQIACSIGGNVAENSGGVHCLKYGLTLHNVLKVRGFTVEGEAVEFGSDALDAAGLDLLALMVGSEGMLAVITEVTVKLVPRPQLARCIMASFDDIRKAGDAVAQIIAAGIIPAGLEMMDKPMTAAVEDYVHAGYDLDAAAILLCESDGTPKRSTKRSAACASCCRARVRRDWKSAATKRSV
jgi:glycolate oxidase